MEGDCFTEPTNTGGVSREGARGAPPLIFVRDKGIAEGRKAGRQVTTPPLPSLAHGLDPPLNSNKVEINEKGSCLAITGRDRQGSPLITLV